MLRAVQMPSRMGIVSDDRWDALARGAVAINTSEGNQVGPRIRFRLPPWRYSLVSIALRLFITCWLVYVMHFATNIVREIYPALTLGDHLTLDVSEYVGFHPDIFEVPNRGAFINNNPGASILGAIPYALARPIIDCVVERVQRARMTSPKPMPEYNTIYPMRREFHRKAYERGLDVKFGLAAGVMQAFLMAPVSALSAAVIFRVLVSLTSVVRRALLLALLYAFATPVFYRTAQLNHNLLIAHCALFAFALLWRPWDDPLRPQRPRYLLAGLLCGWAIVLDYSGTVVVLVLGLYALARRASLPVEARSRADLLRFAIGVVACIAVLMGYQWLAFGSPFLPAQYYMPTTQFSQYGYGGMYWPSIDLLWKTAFGLRFGLFTSAPLLLLALYVPGWYCSHDRIVGRLETWCIVVFTVAFFLFSASNQYGYMQFNTGVRHIVPVTPFLFLLTASVWLRLPTIVATFVSIAATYWSWCLAMYREVYPGLGVLEPLIQITLKGVRLPWLTTLELMGYVRSQLYAPLLLALLSVVILAPWSVDVRLTAARKAIPRHV